MPTKELPCFSDLHLPFNEAVHKSALENRQRDIRDGVTEIPPMHEYLDEARKKLREDKVNYEPAYVDHHRIFVKGQIQ